MIIRVGLVRTQTLMGERVLHMPSVGRNCSKKKIDEIGDAKKAIMEHADHLSYEADVEGITGFMYGCSVNILSHCWEYGEELRKWHNKEYNYEGDGVVNPAIMTIG